MYRAFRESSGRISTEKYKVMVKKKTARLFASYRRGHLQKEATNIPQDALLDMLHIICMTCHSVESAFLTTTQSHMSQICGFVCRASEGKHFCIKQTNTERVCSLYLEMLEFFSASSRYGSRYGKLPISLHFLH